jgi:hypothetical protein
MGQNTLPSRIHNLLLLAERIAHGLEMHRPWLGITQVPPDEFKRTLDAFRNAETGWSTARNAKAAAQTRMTAANQALSAWLAKARLVMMLARGAKWSERWSEIGFTHGGTNVPKRIELRIALARRLVVFLALHPNFGVPFAHVTATHGRSIYERMIHARDALEVASAHCATNKRQRDAVECLLRRMVRQVVLVLRATIGPADPRWLAFGFNGSVSDSPRSRRHYHRARGRALPRPIPLPAEPHPGCQHTVAA